MKIFLLLIIPSLALLYLVNGAHRSEGSHKGKEASTSHSGQEKCQFDYLSSDSYNYVNVNGNTLKYNIIKKFRIGKGYNASVYHAHLLNKNSTSCVALKIYKNKTIFIKEKFALEYFDGVAERNHIIKMLGSGELLKNDDTTRDFIVLELEGKDLKNYFHERIKEEKREIEPRANEDILIPIIKGAAQALGQFHKHAGHNDIKYENFVVSHENNPTDDIIDIKLIDFHTSKLNRKDQPYEVENAKKADITCFGEMVYRLFNEYHPISSDDEKPVPEMHNYSSYDHNSKLDRVIKACFQEENLRPSIDEILHFLNGNIENFPYELKGHEIEEQEDGQSAHHHGRLEQVHEPEHDTNVRRGKKNKKKSSRFCGCF